MTTYIAVGRPVGQIEGPAKVTGRAKFAADLIRPGMLWAKAVRSPLPHARIKQIDISAALQAPGVHAVLTGQDLPPYLYGRRLRDMPPLARDKVRFIGERVAVVAAETEEQAVAACDLVHVEYEELPAVFDVREAMQPDAPRVHETVAGYIGHWEPVAELPNVIARVVRSKGDVDQGFAESDFIFEHTFTTHAVHHGYMEPHACLVELDADGRYHVWTSNKTPFAVKRQLAAVLGEPEERIVVHVVPIGGDFGGKGSLMDVPLCAHLARRTGRPVKMVMDYTEELTAGNPRHPAVITLKTGVKRDGRLWARSARCVWNTGAYGAFIPTPTTTIAGAFQAGGPYRIPHVSIESIGVYTNTVPKGHMRAPGAPQVVFAVESHMDMIAEALGIDPLQFRLINVLQEGDEPPLGGEQLRGVRGAETLQAAADAARWEEKRPPYVGKGIAFYDRHVGSGQATVSLSVSAVPEATLVTLAPDTGTGSHTVLQQVVAEELGLPLERVHVVPGDTDQAEEDAGVGGSRVTHVHGQAALRAARDAKGLLLEAAARLLGADRDAVEMGLEGFHAAGRTVSWSKVVREASQGREGLTVSAVYQGGSTAGVTSFCAQVAEVEVDPETGQVSVKRFVTAHDVGTIINPIGHQGQIEGGIVMGLGYALTEELRIEDGRVTNPHLGEYKLPTIQDIPELVTVLLSGKDGPVPYEGKAIGETSICPVAGAFANAVYDAVGVRILDLPITAEKVYRALRAKQSASAGRPAPTG
jgi:CO/xanthine dehydrogenase Mo-binding subunit